MENLVNVRRGSLSVRFRHPTKTLSYLSELLKLPCFRTWAVGEPRRTPKGGPLDGTYPDSYWVYRTEIQSERGFRNEVIAVLQVLIDVKGAIHDHLTSGGTITVFLQLTGSINNGDEIDSSLLQTMGELGVDFGIEVFPDM
jgi:hypothetical protein